MLIAKARAVEPCRITGVQDYRFVTYVHDHPDGKSANMLA